MAVKAISSIGGAISDLRKGKFESAARRFGVARDHLNYLKKILAVAGLNYNTAGCRRLTTSSRHRRPMSPLPMDHGSDVLEDQYR